MKIRQPRPNRGIALVVVMVVIFMLAVIAGGFAYSMKMELRLARNHDSESELEWLGRSGVELARYVLAQQHNGNPENWDSLNQKWAGGVGVTNENLADITLEDNALGSGTFSIKIKDMERKFNVNVADPGILQQAMNMVGVDAAESAAIADAIQDWRDPDERPRMNGAESDYYLTLNPPYYSKNGPVDDISELLLIKGITPEIFWGPGGPDHLPVAPQSAAATARERVFGQTGAQLNPVGLVDLFTSVSGGTVNLNTASASVLQLFPGIDGNVAQAIVQMRAGPDGVEGNEDDTPFRNSGELVNVPGINRQMVGQLMRFFGVMSSTFQVEVDARIGNYRRHFVALVKRNSARDIPILSFYWQ
jgi:general secretion pathway protein K